MNIGETYSLFKTAENMFRCPICASQTSFRNENSLVCSGGHCFDLSKYGYVNFLPNQIKTKYTKELFESRRHVFQDGFYDPLKEQINSIINELSNGLSHINLLDAGCGEGFFVPGPSYAGRTAEVFALDILKDAIVLAAKGNRNVKWMVGDLSNIPLRSNSIDILLNILAPANYGEFSRVTSDNGYIIKAVPGQSYLLELRESVRGQLVNKEYSNEDVLRHFTKNVAYLDNRCLTYQLPVTECQLENFIQMTPMMFGVDKAKINLSGIGQITIDVEIIIGKKPG